MSLHAIHLILLLLLLLLLILYLIMITHGSLNFCQIRLWSRMLLLSIRLFRLNKLACALASQGTSERWVIMIMIMMMIYIPELSPIHYHSYQSRRTDLYHLNSFPLVLFPR